MFITIKLSSSLPLGTVVQYDATAQAYTSASSNAYPLGVIIRDPQQDSETQVWSARACFAGTCYALAHTDISDQGGALEVVSGRVQVNNSGDNHSGVISPLSLGEPTRTAGNLVMVHLR
jgi:hypothetical protein